MGTINRGIYLDKRGLWTLQYLMHKHLMKVILYVLPSLLLVDINF